jgi:hypothetical protein
MLISIKPPTAWIGHSPCTLNRQNGALDQTAANDSASALAAKVDFLSRPESPPGSHRPIGHRNKLSRCRLLGCVRCVRNPSLRPWLCQRAGAVFVSEGEFVGAAREVIFAQARSHTETNDLLM